MAYDKFDARVDSLVMETKTLWDPAVGVLAEEDKFWLSEAVHRQPQQAKKIAYERSHTGFTRLITVTPDDIARIYRERVGAG
ncbi:MAG TPA: hypothetical protein VFG20_02570 [Planctomycetaceae bacterium]|nr:hypothetical protein [Planctomycetaceae bacterium]